MLEGNALYVTGIDNYGPKYQFYYHTNELEALLEAMLHFYVGRIYLVHRKADGTYVSLEGKSLS